MLETIWFVLWGVLWAVYFILDGFDFGIGTIMPILGKAEEDRKALYNGMGPFWNGNEVWLITAGGVTFAAFPGTYAVMFSSLYSALLLILFALIMRGVAMEFAGKFEGGWKAFWDWCAVAGNFLPGLLFGVAFANIFQGIPIDQNGIYHGSLFTLLNPYGLLGGLFFTAMFVVHGTLWMCIRVEGDLLARSRAVFIKGWTALFVLGAVFLVATWYATPLYENYLKAGILWIIPVVLLASLVAIRFYGGKGQWWKAWGASAVFILSVTAFGVTGLYPNLLPSNMDAAFSMTAFNSASSPMTLKIMLAVALVFVPVVIGYQFWVYRFFHQAAPGKSADAH